MGKVACISPVHVEAWLSIIIKKKGGGAASFRQRKF
jgi:hypothetical protein